MTKRESIIAAFVTALTGTSGVSTRIYRSRKTAFQRAEAPALVIEPVIDDPTQPSIPRLQWGLVLRVSVIVRGDPPDTAADPIIESIHSKLMADVTLGGKAMDIEPIRVNFELLDADGGGGEIILDYRVTYQTSRESLTT